MAISPERQLERLIDTIGGLVVAKTPGDSQLELLQKFYHSKAYRFDLEDFEKRYYDDDYMIIQRKFQSEL
jgi:hypothetical protein